MASRCAGRSAIGAVMAAVTFGMSPGNAATAAAAQPSKPPVFSKSEQLEVVREVCGAAKPASAVDDISTPDTVHGFITADEAMFYVELLSEGYEVQKTVGHAIVFGGHQLTGENKILSVATEADDCGSGEPCFKWEGTLAALSTPAPWSRSTSNGLHRLLEMPCAATVIRPLGGPTERVQGDVYEAPLEPVEVPGSDELSEQLQLIAEGGTRTWGVQRIRKAGLRCVLSHRLPSREDSSPAVHHTCDASDRVRR